MRYCYSTPRKCCHVDGQPTSNGCMVCQPVNLLLLFIRLFLCSSRSLSAASALPLLPSAPVLLFVWLSSVLVLRIEAQEPHCGFPLSTSTDIPHRRTTEKRTERKHTNSTHIKSNWWTESVGEFVREELTNVSHWSDASFLPPFEHSSLLPHGLHGSPAQGCCSQLEHPSCSIRCS